MLGGSLKSLVPYPGGRTIAGYQCVEFSERYLYYKFGVKTLGATNGDQVVDHYAAWYPSLFRAVANGTVGQAPVEGDVLSFSDVNSFNGSSGGHTAVVQSSSVNSSGNGSITIIEENGGKNAANGSQVLTVSGWKVQYSAHPYVKWLHFIGKTVSLPAQPTNPKVKSTTATSAVLTWTDASNNESSFVSQYRIGSGSWVVGPSVGANATSMTVTGLKAGTSYTFQVGARNSAGTHWSAYFAGKTAAQPGPSAPPDIPHRTPGHNRQARHRRSLGTQGAGQLVCHRPDTSGELCNLGRLLRDGPVDHRPLRHDDHVGPVRRRLLLHRRVALHRHQRRGSGPPPVS